MNQPAVTVVLRTQAVVVKLLVAMVVQLQAVVAKPLLAASHVANHL